jgi:thiol peroxidase
MAEITLKGNPINTSGDLPAVGSAAPGFTLVGGDLSDVTLSSFAGKKVILNIVPSFDTGICAASVKKFNEEAGSLGDTVIVNVSKDLPFAQGRSARATMSSTSRMFLRFVAMGLAIPTG